jgi:hypothetical protein
MRRSAKQEGAVAPGLTWQRLRKQRARLPYVFQVVMANMCPGADQPLQAAITLRRRRSSTTG